VLKIFILAMGVPRREKRSLIYQCRRSTRALRRTRWIILLFANHHALGKVHFVEEIASGRRLWRELQISQVLEELQGGVSTPQMFKPRHAQTKLLWDFSVVCLNSPNGQTRALQPQELFASQHYATSVYRSELAARLQELGYELERGKHGQPEIKGYTKEYLEASSPRREQIKDHLRELGIDGAGAAQVAAHRTRDRKELLSPEEVLQRHRELAGQHGHQADRIVAQAREHGQRQRHVHEPDQAAQRAVTYARDHVFERSAVEDRRAILEAALNRGMGQTTSAQVRQEFERRVQAGEFRAVERVGAGQQYTTAAMLRMERETIAHMQEGNRRGYSDPMLVPGRIRLETEDRHPELNAGQRQAVDQIFLSREKIVGLDGVAGAGKTTTLAVIREGAEWDGYKVEGFAPTSRAAQTLADAGIETMTLQAHLARGQRVDTGEHRLYVVDESSLASTKQMHEFVERLHPNDRVLLVGDTRQHESVEAGRIFAQLQDAGMKTVKLEEIVRQKDPELKTDGRTTCAWPGRRSRCRVGAAGPHP
jgi:hypothetical protein